MTDVDPPFPISDSKRTLSPSLAASTAFWDREGVEVANGVFEGPSSGAHAVQRTSRDDLEEVMSDGQENREESGKRQESHVDCWWFGRPEPGKQLYSILRPDILGDEVLAYGWMTGYPRRDILADDALTGASVDTIFSISRHVTWIHTSNIIYLAMR
jgi:hypothetical protein